jgi:putative acetyltransferase
VISEIISSVFDEYGWKFVEIDELPDFVFFEKHYANPENAVLFSIIDESDQVVGSIALKNDGRGPYLSRVYLRAAYRGLGLGKWMTNYMMEMAKSRGFNSIYLWTDTRFLGAHRMYERLGFRMTGELRSLHDVNRSFEFKMEAGL